MLLRKSLMVGALGLAAVCLAQGALDYGTFGAGVALNPDGRAARFDFRVVKPHTGDVRGAFKMGFRGNDGGGFTIDSRGARLAVTRPTGQFGGPGVLVLRRPTGETRRFEGLCTVRVADNRPRGATDGTPDGIDVRFEARGLPAPWTFRGALREGDIVVFDNR